MAAFDLCISQLFNFCVDILLSYIIYVMHTVDNIRVCTIILMIIYYNPRYTPPGRDLYCSPCRLYEPTYRSSPHIPLEEVMWQAEEKVYSDNLLRRLSE